MKTFLCVAEKPSVAKTAARILSKGKFQREETTDKYIKNYMFQCSYKNADVNVIFTSVKGHLFSLGFPDEMSNWQQVDPYDLFSCDVVWEVIGTRVHSNLKKLSKKSDYLMLWLDNDREGERISEEVEEVCLKANPKLKVKRCRFSALSESDLLQAFNNPTRINRAESLAVKLRAETDLRVGTAFTRLQTLKLRRSIERIKQQQLKGEKKTISYGTCQFPTLGFIVDAYNQRDNFVPETFWYINCIIKKDETSIEIKWSRKRLFCKLSCFAIYSSVLSNPKGKVIGVETKPTQKEKPLPLTTVELQRRASKYLKIDPSTTMNVAEHLYSSGYISYPRTETDSFPSNFNFQEIIESLKKSGDQAISKYASNFTFDDPRQGSHSDNAHPPIYPLKTPHNLNDNELKIFNFIARHFLASISKNALGEQTKVFFEIGDEYFHLKGLHIVEKNFLDIYVYTPWNSKTIPVFNVEEEVFPRSIKMQEGQTTAPSLISEPKLIKLMDKEGIGTDATIADHIHKIIARNYTVKKNGTFYPTRIGLALINGYKQMGFDFDKPKLRADLEKTMEKVSQKPESFDDEKDRIINEYEDAYKKVSKNVKILEDSIVHQMSLPDIFEKKSRTKTSSSSSSRKTKAASSTTSSSSQKTKAKSSATSSSSTKTKDASKKSPQKTKTASSRSPKSSPKTKSTSSRASSSSNSKNTTETTKRKKSSPSSSSQKAKTEVASKKSSPKRRSSSSSQSIKKECRDKIKSEKR